MTLPPEKTAVLDAALQGFAEQKTGALEALMPMVYADMRQIARSIRRQQGSRHSTLATTALVHEAYLRLQSANAPDLPNKSAFFALAATLMRRAIVDYIRREHAERRGGSLAKVSLNEGLVRAEQGQPQTLLFSLHEALEQMRAESEQLTQLVEMRFFLGMSQQEIAETWGVSDRTIRRQWRIARAWLIDFLHD